MMLNSGRKNFNFPGSRANFTFVLKMFVCLFYQFLDQDRIVTASSTGAVTIFRHHQNSQVHTSLVFHIHNIHVHKDVICNEPLTWGQVKASDK